MKTTIMRTEKSSRWAATLIATVVAIITCLAVANATQTITTPNAVNIPFNLAASANSAAITPVSGKPVLVMGCCTTGSSLAVGQVSLVHNGFFVWVGLESYIAAAITTGHSAAAGIHIVYINDSHNVDIQTASTNTILIHNGSPSAQAGNVTLIW